MFQKLVLAIFFYAFLNILTKTEGDFITDFRKFREYTNIESNVPNENSVQQLQQLDNKAEQDEDTLQLVKQLKKSRTPIFTEKISVTTMTTMITTKKSKRWNMNWIEAKKETPKSLIKLIRDDNRPVKLLAAVVNTGAKDNLGRAGDKGSGSSTRCGTRRSVVTITRVGDQTVDPNRITTPFEPYTPRTRTQRWSTTIGTSGPRKIWKCVDEEIEDEPATDLSNTIRTVWNDITLPTRLPKYPTPVDPVTKWFLKMTSTYRWRRRPTDKCTKAYVALREAQAMD